MDPIKDGGNWYQYCFSNPVTNWDPTGLSPEESPSGANPKDYNTPYNSCGISSWKYNPINGMLAHTLLEHYFMDIVRLTKIGTGHIEMGVNNYPYSKTGYGIIDIAYELAAGWEVYEIKPITHRRKTDAFYNNRPSGITQRRGYIEALEASGIHVDSKGSTFNPNYKKLSSSLAPNIVFTYYTYYDSRPGMIYWDVTVREKNDPLNDVIIIPMEKPKTDTTSNNPPKTDTIPEEGIAAATTAGIIGVLLYLLETIPQYIPAFL